MANTNIKVTIRNPNRFVVKIQGFNDSACNNPVVLKNNPTLLGNTQLAVEDLTDVISGNEDTGDTLVYDKSLGKWVAKQIDLSDITGNLYGGDF